METTNPQSDMGSDLLPAVAQGDRTAFERLYRLYERRVYQYALTLVNDSSLAEEVLGDTMLALWRGSGSFNWSSRVSTWIFGIARHKALDAIRRVGRLRRETDLDQAANIPEPGETALDSLHRKQIEGVTQRAMAALSQDHQEILRLVFYEELSYDQIAVMLSIPENTVKSRVFYAKQHLKRQLERLGQKEAIS